MIGQLVPPRYYIIKAFYDWIVDEGLTPYLRVDAQHPRVVVPAHVVTQGQVVLDLSPCAVEAFRLQRHALECSVQIGTTIHTLYIPLNAVIELFAQEKPHWRLCTARWWAREEPPPPATDRFTVL